MSVRSVSVYTDTRAKHSCLYTLIQNGHSFCKHYVDSTMVKAPFLGVVSFGHFALSC